MACEPEPFVPSFVDLRGFQFMPLYGDALLDSETWLLCDAEEKVAAFTLWWKSWHQIPAGSLPENPRILSSLAGYGVAVEAWKKVSQAALRGWVKCSDGRLYHRFLAGLVAEAWLGKMEITWRRECDRIRKENKVRAGKGDVDIPFPAKPTLQTIGFPPDKDHVSSGNGTIFHRKPPDVPPEIATPPEEFVDFPPDAPDVSGVRARAEKGQGQGQGESKKESLSLGAREPVTVWQGPTEAHRMQATLLAKDDAWLIEQAAFYRDDCLDKGKLSENHDAGFSKWLRRSPGFEPRGTNGSTSHPTSDPVATADEVRQRRRAGLAAAVAGRLAAGERSGPSGGG